MTKSFVYNDKYAKKAKREGFLARSAYKLEELLDETGIIKQGEKVLDIGSAPGSWLQVVSQRIGKDGLAIGIDLNDTKVSGENIITIKADAFSEEVEKEISKYAPYDAIFSDAAPNTTGIKDRDQALSAQIVENTITLCEKHLKKGGSMIAKIFECPEATKILARAKQIFEKAHYTKPKASRDRSFEQYIIGIKKNK